MKESVSSLRMYFGIVGLLTVPSRALACMGMLAIFAMPGATLAIKVCGALLMLFMGLQCLIGLMYIGFAVALPTLLRSHAWLVLATVAISLASQLVAIPLGFLFGAFSASSLPHIAISLAVNVYLLFQIRRLSGS